MERGSFAQEFIAGNFGGILGISIVYPLDTLKIRQQMNPNGGTMFQMFNAMRHADGVTSFLFIFLSPPSKIKSLYRGILSPVVGFGFTFAVSFRSIGPLPSSRNSAVPMELPVELLLSFTKSKSKIFLSLIWFLSFCALLIPHIL
jgi:hypothetical protein